MAANNGTDLPGWHDSTADHKRTGPGTRLQPEGDNASQILPAAPRLAVFHQTQCTAPDRSAARDNARNGSGASFPRPTPADAMHWETAAPQVLPGCATDHAASTDLHAGVLRRKTVRPAPGRDPRSRSCYLHGYERVSFNLPRPIFCPLASTCGRRGGLLVRPADRCGAAVVPRIPTPRP